MPPVGKVSATKLENGETLLEDESGQSWTWPAPMQGPRISDFIDPRIDLTKPIYAQVQKLAAKDRAAAKRKRSSSAA